MSSVRRILLEKTITSVLAEARALAAEMGVKPIEALYALMPSLPET